MLGVVWEAAGDFAGVLNAKTAKVANHHPVLLPYTILCSIAFTFLTTCLLPFCFSSILRDTIVIIKKIRILLMTDA